MSSCRVVPLVDGVPPAMVAAGEEKVGAALAGVAPEVAGLVGDG